MIIDSADFTNEERDEACAWMDATGHPAREVRHRFTVEPALPGSVKLTFEWYQLDPDGNHRSVEQFDAVHGQRVYKSVTEPFTIYASDRLGWLQRYLERTGTTLA